MDTYLECPLPENDFLLSTCPDGHNRTLTVEAIAEAKSEIAADLGAAAQARSERRVQALQIVQFKLDKLEQHLKTSSRLLNDLRTLRRLLLDERPEPTTATSDQDSAE